MYEDLPQPFRAALEAGRPGEAVDAPAESPPALFGRGLARAEVGREGEALADLEAAAQSLGDPCRVEIGFLRLRRRDAPAEIVRFARDIRDRTAPGSLLRARAEHLLGLAEGKLRRTDRSIEALLRAAEIYRARGRRALLAGIHDTLGMVYAARGRLDYAQGCFARSIVGKSVSGDRRGMAISLGNLGRIHLRTGCWDDARDCFELDLEIARELGDERGRARMHEDLGRALLEGGVGGGQGGGESAAAEHFARCLEIARANGYADLEFFAHKDLALAHLRGGRIEEAGRELELAEASLPRDADPYLEALLLAVRGRWLLARGDRASLQMLRDAREKFERADLPDDEISALVLLADAAVRFTDDAGEGRAMAERCLRKALHLARADGYARHLRSIREEMQKLTIAEGLAEESERLSFDEGSPAEPEGYTLLERLGSGGFGVVYRAFDPVRARIVAIKRLSLDRIYDPDRRRKHLLSARLELEAASRISHPGVARVLALGTDVSGETYVVQEYIEGRSLRAAMSGGEGGGGGRRAEPEAVFRTARLIAGALGALHEQGVVHRDLKPENVILRCRDGSPVLIDFGIAYLADRAGEEGDDTVAGTFGYMAPERLAGKPFDGRADVYSLGVICYEWLAGVRPGAGAAAGGGCSTVFFRTSRVNEWDPLSMRRPDLDREAVSVVHALLEPDPAGRPDAARAAALCAGLCADSPAG